MPLAFLLFVLSLSFSQIAFGMEIPHEENQHPLHTMIHSRQQVTFTMLQDLFEHGGDFQELYDRDENGETLVHLAARYGAPSVIVLLHDHGADLNALNNKQLTPLDLAKQLNNTQVETALNMYISREKEASKRMDTYLTNNS